MREIADKDKEKKLSRLRIKGWDRFQHYSDRNPPWIKLHRDILLSEDWIVLSDASKLYMVVCMLIASRNKGTIPNNTVYLREVSNLNKFDLKPLIQSGFLVPVADDSTNASNLQADAIIEKSREEENRVEKKHPSFSLPEDVNPDTWQAFEESRKKLKKPMTDRARKLILDKLKEIGGDPNEALNRSIMHGWIGVFEDKSKQTVSQQHIVEKCKCGKRASGIPGKKGEPLCRDCLANEVGVED